MLTHLQDIREKRFRYLLKLHEKSQVDTLRRFNYVEVGKEAGFTEEEISPIATYLSNMINSQFQQATVNSVQTGNFSEISIQAVKDFTNEVNSNLAALPLEQSQKEEVKAELASIEAQVKSPKPKTAILKECLLSIKSILEGIAGNALAAMLLAKLKQMGFVL